MKVDTFESHLFDKMTIISSIKGPMEIIKALNDFFEYLVHNKHTFFSVEDSFKRSLYNYLCEFEKTEYIQNNKRLFNCKKYKRLLFSQYLNVGTKMSKSMSQNISKKNDLHEYEGIMEQQVADDEFVEFKNTIEQKMIAFERNGDNFSKLKIFDEILTFLVQKQNILNKWPKLKKVVHEKICQFEKYEIVIKNKNLLDCDKYKKMLFPELFETQKSPSKNFMDEKKEFIKFLRKKIEETENSTDNIIKIKIFDEILNYLTEKQHILNRYADLKNTIHGKICEFEKERVVIDNEHLLDCKKYKKILFPEKYYMI